MTTTTTTTTTTRSKRYCYEATGVVANTRLRPLLPDDWIDVTSKSKNDSNDDDSDVDNYNIPDFLWENCPRQDTKAYRDDVKVYSHLPNGSAILDSKWVLGRLLVGTTKQQGCDEGKPRYEPSNPHLAICETHCFTGLNGFREFASRMKLLDIEDAGTQQLEHNESSRYEFFDILKRSPADSTKSSCTLRIPKCNVLPRPSLWVIKDAMANGAGGVWVVGRDNASDFLKQAKTPLYEEHKYVAQEYVWPLITYGGKKCHVRIYVTITCDGRAFVHQRAFLHVANEPFTLDRNDRGSDQPAFDDCVHITNCCANSHDGEKFAGEILADLTMTKPSLRDGQEVVPLADFFPSVQATVTELTKQAFPFMDGGHRNHGFEYCGMDFMLSYDTKGTPLVYLLEVNAPPSQDTATGLSHAENLHDDVLRDWMNFWVVPCVMGQFNGVSDHLGGWKCVYDPLVSKLDISSESSDNDELILPSKAAILNKIRWALFEKRAQKNEALPPLCSKDDTHGMQQPSILTNASSTTLDDISKFARSKFPYFSTQSGPIFFENAGGAQVPQTVVDSMLSSLQYRHRSVIGTETKNKARETMKTLFGAIKYGSVIIGPNATSLLASLAECFVEQNVLRAGDEVVIGTENHLAHFGHVQPRRLEQPLSCGHPLCCRQRLERQLFMRGEVTLRTW
jgi:hypothetical protein